MEKLSNRDLNTLYSLILDQVRTCKPGGRHDLLRKLESIIKLSQNAETEELVMVPLSEYKELILKQAVIPDKKTS